MNDVPGESDPPRADQDGGDARDVRESDEGRHGAVITDARTAKSAEMRSRVRRYTITMAFRMVCFVALIWVRGPAMWVLFACAVFLPYIAVIVANQANQRTKGRRVAHGAPSDVPQLTTGHVEVITGDVVTEADRPRSGTHDERSDRVA